MSLKKLFIKRWYLVGVGWWLSHYFYLLYLIRFFHIPEEIYTILYFPFIIAIRGLHVVGPPITDLPLYILIVYSVAKILEIREEGTSIMGFYITRWWMVPFIWLFLTPSILTTSYELHAPLLWKILAFPFFLIIEILDSVKIIEIRELPNNGIYLDRGYIDPMITIPIIITSYFISCYLFAKILEFWQRKDGNR